MDGPEIRLVQEKMCDISVWCCTVLYLDVVTVTYCVMDPVTVSLPESQSTGQIETRFAGNQKPGVTHRLAVTEDSPQLHE